MAYADGTLDRGVFTAPDDEEDRKLWFDSFPTAAECPYCAIRAKNTSAE